MLRAFGNEARLSPGPEYTPLTNAEVRELDNRAADRKLFDELYKQLDTLRTEFNCKAPDTQDGETQQSYVIHSLDCLLEEINTATGVLKDD